MQMTTSESKGQRVWGCASRILAHCFRIDVILPEARALNKINVKETKREIYLSKIERCSYHVMLKANGDFWDLNKEMHLRRG